MQRRIPNDPVDSGPVGTEPAAQPVGMDAVLKIEGKRSLSRNAGTAGEMSRPTSPNCRAERPRCRPGLACLLGAGCRRIGRLIRHLRPRDGLPTTVSRTEVETENGGTLVLEKTVREVIGGAIDDAVDWVTREAAWLFDGLSSAVAYSLVAIEDVLKWVPWPTVVVALSLFAFAVGRWRLLGFTLFACSLSASWTCGRTRSTPSRSWSSPS